MPLDAHLGDDAGFLRRLGQHAGFVNVMGERFLAEDVFAQLHRRHADHRVRVVGRSDEHGIDVLLLLQHHAVVLVSRGVGKRIEGFRGVAVVHIAERDDVSRTAGGQVVVAHAADADAGDVHLFARRRVARPAEHMARHDLEKTRGGGGFEKGASLGCGIHGCGFWARCDYDRMSRFLSQALIFREWDCPNGMRRRVVWCFRMQLAPKRVAEIRASKGDTRLPRDRWRASNFFAHPAVWLTARDLPIHSPLKQSPAAICIQRPAPS